MPVGSIADIDDHRVKFERQGFRMVISLDYLRKIGIPYKKYFAPIDLDKTNMNAPIIDNVIVKLSYR